MPIILLHITQFNVNVRINIKTIFNISHQSSCKFNSVTEEKGYKWNFILSLFKNLIDKSIDLNLKKKPFFTLFYKINMTTQIVWPSQLFRAFISVE